MECHVVHVQLGGIARQLLQVQPLGGAAAQELLDRLAMVGGWASRGKPLGRQHCGTSSLPSGTSP